MANITIFSGAAGALILALSYGQGAAQAAAIATAAGLAGQPQIADPAELQEIVVTAQRREEKLSKVPVSVKAFSNADLTQEQIVSQHDLQTVTPGLQVRSARTGEELNYSLRGQSQDQFTSTRPGVLPYLNDVQVAGQLSSSSFYDLQSIQVLKGPQGTLFGRSATGGAVLYTTNKPTDDLEGYVSALGGNYGQREYQGAVSGPLIPQELLARVAFYDFSRDGFETNVANDSNLGFIKRFGARGSLIANFSDDAHNDLVVDYFHAKGQSTVAAISGIMPFTGTPPPAVPTALLYSGTATPAATLTGECTLQAFAGFPSCAASGGPLPAISAFYTSYFSQPNHPAGGLTGYLATQLARGPYLVDVDDPYHQQNNLLLSDTLTFTINPALQVKNIFGYGLLRLMDFSDNDGTPYGIEVLEKSNPNDALHDDTREFSDEVQLQGVVFDARLNYTFGAYFADEKENFLYQQHFFDVIFGGANQTNAFETSSRTYAIYGQSTYQITESGLSATLGLRYTSEKQGLDTLPNDSARIELGEPAPPGYAYGQSKRFGLPSFTAGLQDQLTNEILLYAVTRLAYKTGGFNGPLPPKIGDAAQGGDAFRSESVHDVEVGAKYAGTIGHVPVTASLDYYHSWDNDAQRVNYAFVDGQPTNLTVNVPQAQVDGVEFDGQLKPRDWLTLGTNFAYTHARYTNGDVNLFGTITKYDQVTDTPSFSGAGYVDITFPLVGSTKGTLHADVYGQEKTQTSYTSLDDYGSATPSYVLTGFRFIVANAAGHWSVTANLKNAFNRVYYTGGSALGPLNSLNLLVPGEPRTFTVGARYTF
jgi:iron complex outermembrane receptor protein